ncbi:MAG TPA: hypothetical protein VFC54_05485 [Pseudolabrys sp.]|nr:hypothetical protein [Pseudolabrys sp.]
MSDEAALGLARQELPEVKSLTIKDCFFQDIRDEIASIEAPKRGINEGVNILFVSEPIREGGLVLHGDERYWGFTEEEALRYFLTNLGRLFDRVNRIVIRSHPKESRDKYVWTLSEFDLPIIVSEDLPLLHQIVASDVVVGCATMAMAIAVLAEKRVISCIPPGGRLSPPPHAEIKEMRSLLA